MGKVANGCNKKMDIRTSQSKTEARDAFILPNGNGCHANGHHLDQPGATDCLSCDEQSDSSCRRSLSNGAETPRKAVLPENGEMKRTKTSIGTGHVGDSEMPTHTKNGGRNGTEGLEERETKDNGTGRGQEEREESSSPSSSSEEEALVPMALYQHRVRALVLALLVEPHFHTDQAAVEEVVSVRVCVCVCACACVCVCLCVNSSSENIWNL